MQKYYYVISTPQYAYPCFFTTEGENIFTSFKALLEKFVNENILTNITPDELIDDLENLQSKEDDDILELLMEFNMHSDVRIVIYKEGQYTPIN